MKSLLKIGGSLLNSIVTFLLFFIICSILYHFFAHNGWPQIIVKLLTSIIGILFALKSVLYLKQELPDEKIRGVLYLIISMAFFLTPTHYYTTVYDYVMRLF